MCSRRLLTEGVECETQSPMETVGRRPSRDWWMQIVSGGCSLKVQPGGRPIIALPMPPFPALPRALACTSTRGAPAPDMVIPVGGPAFHGPDPLPSGAPADHRGPQPGPLSAWRWGSSARLRPIFSALFILPGDAPCLGLPRTLPGLSPGVAGLSRPGSESVCLAPGAQPTALGPTITSTRF